MVVAFESLPDESRIWIYQAERELTPEEQGQITALGQDFLGQWATHGQPLHASLAILKNYFLVIGVDDRQLPSGCSIDASVGFVREVGNRLQLDFFNRTRVPLLINDAVKTVPLNEVKDQIKHGAVSEDTLLVNTLVQQKGDLSRWIVSLKESWLGRYFPQTQLK